MSNLGWSANHHGDALALIAALGVQGIEVAPTKIAPWTDLAPKALCIYRSEVEAAGLCVSSLQAIFYGVQGASLLEDDAAFNVMTNHMRQVGEIGAILGATVAVYGAPSTRLRRDLALDTARTLAAHRFTALGDIAQSFGITIGIEPVPQAYGGDFLSSAFDVIDLVREIDHPFVKLHLDTACALLAGDEIEEAIRNGFALLGHFHVSEPNLGHFSHPKARHQTAYDALRQFGYDKWLAIEMREHADEPMRALREAIEYVVTTYQLLQLKHHERP